MKNRYLGILLVALISLSTKASADLLVTQELESAYQSYLSRPSINVNHLVRNKQSIEDFRFSVQKALENSGLTVARLDTSRGLELFILGNDCLLKMVSSKAGEAADDFTSLTIASSGRYGLRLKAYGNGRIALDAPQMHYPSKNENPRVGPQRIRNGFKFEVGQNSYSVRFNEDKTVSEIEGKQKVYDGPTPVWGIFAAPAQFIGADYETRAGYRIDRELCRLPIR